MIKLQSHQITVTSLWATFVKGRSKKTTKIRVTGFCEGNSPVTGEFPAQRSTNAENVSIWWRHHEVLHISRLGSSHSWVMVGTGKVAFKHCGIVTLYCGLVASRANKELGQQWLIACCLSAPCWLRLCIGLLLKNVNLHYVSSLYPWYLISILNFANLSNFQRIVKWINKWLFL